MIAVKCMLIKAGVPTVNGRIYPVEALENAIDQVKMPILGGIGNDPSARTQISECSHEIQSLHVSSDGRLVGEVKILDTPAGKILTEMVESGIAKLTLHPYFMGSLDSNNTLNNDLRIQKINVCFIADVD